MTDPVIVGEENTCSTDKQTKDQLETYVYFPCPVYRISKPEYLESVNIVMKEHIDKIKETREINPIFPLYQTGLLLGEDRIRPFIDYIGATSWNILESQGYAMSNLTVYFQELWGQEHYKHSAHEEHVHGHGCQLVGFYFLDTPENSSRLVIHDPRPAKRLVNLPEADMTSVTMGSVAINFEPKAGDLYFVPSWIPHSFSRHSAEEPIKFIHFTIGTSAHEPTVDVDTGLPPKTENTPEVV